MIHLSFHGASREVTGSSSLLTDGKISILIDCGLFQGNKECEDLNFEKFRFDPAAIDAVLVTHAHLDHVGRIPKLFREGFSGMVYSTAPTRDLARLLLEDAFSVSVREGKQLYEEKDLKRALSQWQATSYDTIFEIGDAKARFAEAGHILGSSFVELWLDKKHFLFTGDVGNAPSAFLPEPEMVRDIEYLITESTYGNRVHEDTDGRVLLLERAIEDAAARGGTLMIPAFATERTQDILFYLNEMVHFRRIPEMPVFVDAPLAIRVTGVYEQYVSYYRDEIRKLFIEHPNLFKFKKLHFTESVQDSKAINEVPPPKVIIAGSGMMHGGRILHHMRRYLSDAKSILLIVGYQAAGSLGRRLLDGAKAIKLFGEDISVEAEIRRIDGFSAHADYPQLFAYAEHTRDTLKKVFVIHGEEAETLYFSQEIKDRLGVEAVAPMLHEKFEIE